MLATECFMSGREISITSNGRLNKTNPTWKGYNVSNAAKVDNDPNSAMRQWRHDDERVAYPTFELIANSPVSSRRSRASTTSACTKA
jgi:hypothetical protein